MNKRWIISLMCLCLVFQLALPAFAAEDTAEETAEPEVTVTQLTISSIDEFLLFAENCRLDSYSQNLAVTLNADLDLTDTDFSGIPIFCGSFDGNGHSISNLLLEQEGSVVGLFRYLTDTAVVSDLTLSGQIAPNGSRSMVGAIAGSNAGRIENCHFSGTVSGADTVGGLVGENLTSGIIDSCTVQGQIQGNHFVGGFVGKNLGVIRACQNNAAVNTTSQQNTVDITDITLDSLTDTESANTVTDVGGIAGTSSGVIRNCTNTGDVGYKHMAYNIGGISGSSSGYITECENLGNIQGRKEVGGIVGHLEPAALLEFDEDALQILQGQLDAMGGIVNQTSASVQSAGNELTTQLGDLQEQMEDVTDALETLIPSEENPTLPDEDTLKAAQTTLSSSFTKMQDSVQDLATTTQDAFGSLSSNLFALQSQINTMSATLGAAQENLGGNIQDASDLDTEEDITAKISSCTNSGDVLGDWNVGGIVGTMAMETALDSYEGLDILGNNSLNFNGQIRAVILSCENTGTVTGKKQNIGGIVGWLNVGLVKQCMNSGAIDAAAASYVGGIAGLSNSYLRLSSAKCIIAGGDYTGGIAGGAAIATDCRSMILFTESGENTGAVLGVWEKNSELVESTLSGNFYLVTEKDPGAIDGISYSGLAEPLVLKDFLGLEDLDGMFHTVTVRFEYADGTDKCIYVATGSSISPSRIPELPHMDGFIGHWEDLSTEALENVMFDLTFCAVYSSEASVIQAESLRAEGLPILLAQGNFTPEAYLSLESSISAPLVESRHALLESWRFESNEQDRITALRAHVPAEASGDIVLYLLSKDGQWRQADYSTDASYLVFQPAADDIGYALVEHLPLPIIPIAAGCAAVALLAAAIVIFKKRKAATATAEV